MKRTLAVFLLSLVVGGPSWAVEPMNPEALCERFIRAADSAGCLKKAKTMDLDWYAASVCNQLEEDDRLMDCWAKIDGRTYSPSSLSACAAVAMKDEERLACLGQGGRRPASSSPGYQPLKLKK